MSNIAPSGYSGTPLARKLGIQAGFVVACIDAPGEYAEWLAPLPEGVTLARAVSARCQLVHLFALERPALARQLAALRGLIGPQVPVWVSWPKRASRVPTDITEDVIRALALPLGYVDIKVCAVSEVWSGLKLVVRKELRTRAGLERRCHEPLPDLL